LRAGINIEDRGQDQGLRLRIEIGIKDKVEIKDRDLDR
jgi:hypothetical protein